MHFCFPYNFLMLYGYWLTVILLVHYVKDSTILLVSLHFCRIQLNLNANRITSIKKYIYTGVLIILIEDITSLRICMIASGRLPYSVKERHDTSESSTKVFVFFLLPKNQKQLPYSGNSNPNV